MFLISQVRGVGEPTKLPRDTYIDGAGATNDAALLLLVSTWYPCGPVDLLSNHEKGGHNSDWHPNIIYMMLEEKIDASILTLLTRLAMDDLLLEFQRCATLSMYNPTPFHLEVQPGGGVIARQYLQQGITVGEIHGIPTYIWDITHQDYMIVGDEFVLDVSQQYPRPILTYVREENASDTFANCLLVTESCEHTGTNRFFLRTIRDIHPGQELVYITMDYPYY